MNRKRLPLFCLVIILLTRSGVLGVEINEDNVVDIARKNSRELKIARENLEIAQAKLYEGFSGFLPKVNLGLSYTRLSAPQIAISGPAAAMFAGSISPALVSETIFGGQISVQQPIFMWGKIYYGNKQVYLNYLLAKEKYRQTENEITYKAKENFYRALLAGKMLKIAQASVDLSQTYYETAKKLYAEGKSSSYDVSRAKVGLTNARLNLLRAENSQKLAGEALKTFLAIKEDIEITGEFKYEENDFILADLLNQARNSRPEIKSLQWQKELGQSQIKFYSADNKPQIFGSYLYTAQSADLNTSFDHWDKRWQAVLTVQWPLFDGLATFSRIKQARNMLEQIQESCRALEEAVELEVRSAYLNFVQARQAIEAQKENVQTAEDNLKIASQRYALGLMSYLELQDVHLALSQAETNYQQSLYDYNLALAMIQKVTGQ